MIEWLNFFRKKISNDNVVTDEDLINTKRALQKIIVVSKKLYEENFCRMFDSALKVFNLDLSNEEKAKQILSRSQVFGGISSWNDTPRYTAYKFGIEKEYEEVTEDLFRQLTILRKIISAAKND